MGIIEIAGIIIGLVVKYGPDAMEVWNNWTSEVGDEPTPEQWKALKDKIAAHNPDTY